MARIRVTPEQVREVAKQFKTAGQQSDGIVRDLERATTSLQSEWEGMTQQKFYSEYDQWRKQMNHFTQLLTDIARQLDEIAIRFERADQV